MQGYRHTDIAFSAYWYWHQQYSWMTSESFRWRKEAKKGKHLSKIDLGLFRFTFSPLNPGNPKTDIQPDTKTHRQAQDKNNPEMKWVRCSFSLEQTNTIRKKMLYKTGRISSLPYTHLYKNMFNAHRVKLTNFKTWVLIYPKHTNRKNNDNNNNNK